MSHLVSFTVSKMQCSNATCYKMLHVLSHGIKTCFHVPCSDHFLFSLFWSDSLQFYMTTVCWLYVHSLGFFNSYIDLNQYAQYKEMAHFSAASFVLKKSTMHRSIGLSTRNWATCPQRLPIFANQIVNISINAKVWKNFVSTAEYMCPGGQVVRTSFYTSLSPL